MAQLTITIPDGIAARVNDGVAKYHGYQETINGQPNPETKVQFSKRMVKETLKMWVVQAESSSGFETANATAKTEINIQD